MVSRAQLQVMAALAGVVAASAVITDGLQHQLWADCALGTLVLVTSAAFVLRLQTLAVQDPPVSSPPQSDGATPLSVFIEQVPIPLLRFSAAQGLRAVNRAARSLFHTDDLIADPPVELRDAVAQAEPGVPAGAVTVFGRSYAMGMSEIVTSRDILRLVSLTDIQSEVRMAEATALRDLLRVLSHEIMNSLTPVAHLAEVARDYLADETSPAAGAAREALEVLSQRASGLARFVEAYRSMAKLPEPILRPIEIASLLRDVVRVFEQSLDSCTRAIELALPADVLTLDLDETLMTQALLNVLTNAAEATAAMPGQGRIQVALVHDRNEVRIFISDNGCGVPDDLAEQIFHAFITTKTNGTGTGLNLARQIALAQGGDLIFCGRNDSWSAIFGFILRPSTKLLSVD